jgi:ribose transport system substrate-binding protein
MHHKPVIGLVMKSLQAEFFQNMKKGALVFAEKHKNLELITTGTDSQIEIDQQIKLVESLILKQVDALVVIPIDSKALVPVAVKAIKAGIKVVNIDIKLDSELLLASGIEIAFVGPDNESAAKMVSDVLSKKLGKGARVIIIEGLPVAENAQMRKLGFLKSIDEYGLNLVDSGVADWETEKAKSVFTVLFEKHQDIEGVMCANDAMAIGVIKVLEESGKIGAVKVIGFDNDVSVGPLIKNEKMLATIDCYGSEMAAEGISYALRELEGEKLKGWIKTKTTLITKI